MNKSKSKLLPIVSLCVLGSMAGGIAVAQPEYLEVSRQLEKVQARGKVLPLDRVGTNGTADKIRVDGNLEEWGNWSRRSGLFLQDMDHLSYNVAENPKDAAGVKLLRDDDALYIGVRVLDDSIYNTKTEQEGYNWQDCVELFLDVRPITTRNGLRLGDSRTSGFYQLLIVPPTPARPGLPAQPLRWGSSSEQAQLAQIGPIEIASTVHPGGYDMEMRIPYSSLYGATAKRFDEAIGFDLYVDDTDLVGESAHSIGRKTAAEVYSWGGLSIGAFDPGRLAAASPDAAPLPGKTPPAPEVSPVLWRKPAKLVTPRTQYPLPNSTATEGNAAVYPPTILRAGILEPADAKEPDESITLSPTYSATIFDTEAPDEKPAFTLSPLKYRLLPGLDAQFAYRELTYQKIPGGRYSCTTSFAPASEAASNPPSKDSLIPTPSLIRFYANTWGDALTVRTIAPDFPTNTLAQAFQNSAALVESINHYASVGEPIAGKLEIGGDLWGAGNLWNLSEQAQAALQQQQQLPFVYRLKIYEDGKEAPIHTTDVPLQARTASFSLPAALLGAGKYHLEATPVDTRFAVPPRTPAARTGLDYVSLTVAAKRDATWPAEITDAPKVWSHAEDLGSPNRVRFPLDDIYDAPRRSVACLQWFENYLYVGSGSDYQRESTIIPAEDIDIWSIPAGHLLPGAKPDWILETSLKLNQVAQFRVADNQLLVSSTRIFPWHTTIPLKAYSGGRWKTLPDLTGWQLSDILPYEGKLYASIQLEEGSTLLESGNGGISWETKLLLNESRSPQLDLLAPLPGGLLLTSNMSERGASLYSEGQVKPLPIDLFPSYPTHLGMRTTALQAFNEGVVYTAPAESDKTPTRRPLYFLRDLDRGAVIIEPFSNVAVQDIKVRDGLCYILTAEAENKAGENKANGGFKATVYSSPDLKQWTKRAVATLPALPNALELTRDAFYIGLANRNANFVDAASGSVWAITE